MLHSKKLLVATGLSVLSWAAAAQTAAAPATQPAEAQATPGTQAPAAAQDGDNIVRTAFRRADVNADAQLSREEAAALPAVAEKFTQLDRNSDGFLSAAEFEAGVTAAPPASR